MSISNSLSEQASVIEASGRDRPGLMAALADRLADEGVSLLSAQIDGYGERAMDVFYVTFQGRKLEDEALMERIREGFLTVLGESEAVLEETAARRGMARARASALR